MNIFVGNLSYGVTEDELNELFSAHGQVNSVTLIINHETGEPKGFAFVDMERQADTENAIKSLNGSAFKGRNLKANLAQPKGKNTKTKRRGR